MDETSVIYSAEEKKEGDQMSREERELSPLERVIAVGQQVDPRINGEMLSPVKQTTSDWSEEEDDDEYDFGIKLNFGRPAKPEECLSDDEVSLYTSSIDFDYLIKVFYLVLLL